MNLDMTFKEAAFYAVTVGVINVCLFLVGLRML